MVRNYFRNYFSSSNYIFGKSKPKRKKFTAHERNILWDSNQHICHICHKRISKITDCEFDHIKAYSKGGKKIALSHRSCNRGKSSKSIQKFQEHMGFKVIKKKTTKKKTKKRKRRIQSTYNFGFKLPKR